MRWYNRREKKREREKGREGNDDIPIENGAKAELLMMRSESAAQRSGRNSRGCFHAFGAMWDVNITIHIQHFSLRIKEEGNNDMKRKCGKRTHISPPSTTAPKRPSPQEPSPPQSARPPSASSDSHLQEQADVTSTSRL